MSSIGTAAVATSTAIASSTLANQSKRESNKNGPGTPRSTLKAVDSFGNSSFDSSLDSPTVPTNSGLLSRFNFLVNSKSNNQTQKTSQIP
jgi:hypothetical protein